MGARRKAREIALQLLFQMDITKESVEEAFSTFFCERSYRPEIEEFAKRLAIGTSEYCEKIDKIISKNLDNWRLPRIAVVDRNILRMAVYEFIYEPSTPKKVIINEAIEIGKKYGSKESGQFINGVLDAIKQKLPVKKRKKQS
jgi:N utilization substance protein B